MKKYLKKPTQEERILKLLRERGGVGVKVWEFMMPRNQGGCGIAQYNARIFGPRKKGYNIINTKPGHFYLKEYEEEEIETGNASQLVFT